MNIVKIIDFTQEDGSETDDEIKENTLSESEEQTTQAIDQNGHGTFVAGVIGSKNPKCPGIAPETEIYILKLFTDEEITYSSWFLDAFNFPKVVRNGQLTQNPRVIVLCAESN